MKPTVINNNNNTENNLQNNPSDTNNNTKKDTDYEGFSQTFPSRGFGLDDSDDDIFSDIGLRSRLNRLGTHPFDWCLRKRRGSAGQAETTPNSYDQYFRDDEAFPGFCSQWNTLGRGVSGRKRNEHPKAAETIDRSGFFDYLPPEFRPFIPESFSYPHVRHQQYSPMARSPPIIHQNPKSFVSTNSSYPSRCDAAIQTEDIEQNHNLNQHGLRNTVDLGQKSQPEEIKTNRSNSAPPPETENGGSEYVQTIPASSIFHIPETYINSKLPSEANKLLHECNSPPNTSNYNVQFQPQDNTRTVPIFIEGRNTSRGTSHISPPIVLPTTGQPTQKKQQSRPTPFIAKDLPQNSDDQSQYPLPLSTPNTPHTSDCIFKIQTIQRNVLDLMEKVEKFSGYRGDKDYMNLDEMLTINLLKLDTIDTNGRERIRLARKEAIKCIQASIAVLEAKADLNLKRQQENYDNVCQISDGINTTQKINSDVDVQTNCLSDNENLSPSEARNVSVVNIDIKDDNLLILDNNNIAKTHNEDLKTEANNEKWCER